VKELMKRTFEMFAVDFFLQLGPDFRDYFRGTTLPQSKISEIKKLHHFGLDFSDISKQTGISRKTISKYISGDISDTKMRQLSKVVPLKEQFSFLCVSII
jgi:hypothetical protein